MNLPSGWTIQAVAQVAGVVATLLAILAALFKEEIVRLWRRPRLTASIHLVPPGADCHKTELVVHNVATGQVLARGDCYYFRLWVENKGYQRAEKVHLRAHGQALRPSPYRRSARPSAPHGQHAAQCAAERHNPHSRSRGGAPHPNSPSCTSCLSSRT